MINLVGKNGRSVGKITDNIEDDTFVVDGEQKSYLDAAAEKEESKNKQEKE